MSDAVTTARASCLAWPRPASGKYYFCTTSLMPPTAWMTGDHAAAETHSRPVLLKPFHIDRVSAVLTEVRKSSHLLIKPRNQPGRLPSSDSALGGASFA